MSESTRTRALIYSALFPSDETATVALALQKTADAVSARGWNLAAPNNWTAHFRRYPSGKTGVRVHVIYYEAKKRRPPVKRKSNATPMVQD